MPVTIGLFIFYLYKILYYYMSFLEDVRNLYIFGKRIIFHFKVPRDAILRIPISEIFKFVRIVKIRIFRNWKSMNKKILEENK